MENAPQTGYRVYWVIFLVLLVLALLMTLVGGPTLARPVVAPLLIGAMLVKAALISGYFMHLRHERVALIVAVAISILAVGAVLFVGIAPDGLRAARLGE